MKVALAPHYRGWMLVLFPTTLGFGTVLLWMRSLRWPLQIDEGGLTLRCLSRVEWRSIRRIGVTRSYLDGHISQLRIHDGRGRFSIPVHDLRDGQNVARTILTQYERRCGTKSVETRLEMKRTRRNGLPPMTRSPKECDSSVDNEITREAAVNTGAVAQAPSRSQDLPGQEVGVVFPSSSDVAGRTRRGIQFADLWPPAVIALGLVLTLIWTAGLAWLSYLLV